MIMICNTEYKCKIINFAGTFYSGIEEKENNKRKCFNDQKEN